jgi:hypothetical protein
MSKTPTDIRSLARSHTESAIRVLAGIMNKEAAPDSARVAAANSLLDRGWGKPSQPIENGNGAFEVIQRIERTIVQPANPNG